MTSYIVVFGLIVVVVLVVVLVALGLRASRTGRDDDDWIDDEPQPRGRRGVPPHEEMGGQDDYGYNDGYDGGYDRHGAPDPALDRRVAGGPLAAPTAAPSPPPPAPSGQASDEMEDDDYWATITFDKPKFPWQHDHDGERSDVDLAADPLHAQPPIEQPQAEQPGPIQPSLTQPVSMGADAPAFNGMGVQGGGTGPQQMPAPGGFQGGSPFTGHDPASTSLDPLPADLAGPGMQGGVPQQGYGAPDQQVYGGQEPQPAYGAADYGPGEASYGGQDHGYGDQPQYGSPEPSYGDYGSDPLGGRPAAGPPPGGRQDGYDMPLGPGGPRGGDPRVSDPLGLPLGRPDEHSAPPAPPASAVPAMPAAPAAHGGPGGGSDTDGHKLPTVDELLQRIQSDRQRSAGTGPSSDAGGSYGGGSLNDPLGDPLSTGSFGTTGGTGNTGNTGPWPSGGHPGGYDPGLGSGAPSGPPPGYDPGMGAPAGYGQGQQNDGYPTAPAYGESPRYDDPLNGGREPYGGFGGAEGGPAGAGGVYGDFSGSSYNGGADPLAAPHDPGAQGGYQDPNATQAYGGGYYGGQQQDGYPQGGQTNDNGQYGPRQTADDWENYRR
ncbi:hypothetical protein [Spirillospora sp. NPDC048823]|uniref:hypothetical protein n=1 Tax=unclassified Spirillospora TaxID=2642701 RepID=UPI003715F51F